MAGGQPIAHLRQGESSKWLFHPLDEHLHATASLAREFSDAFGNGDWGRAAGLWHDLGKFKPAFQAYIRGVNGLDAHLEEDGSQPVSTGKVDHSAAGAIHAVSQNQFIGKILSYLIAGHHSGLPDWIKDEESGRGLEERLGEKTHLEEVLLQSPPASILEAPVPTSLPCGRSIDTQSLHLWIRMLFSCLVDADFLDTEAFMDPAKSVTRIGRYDLCGLREKFDRHMAAKQEGASDTGVNRLRRQILEDCRRGAEMPPGFFSLTVPTGGGKTLASMGFALDHAIRHGKRRIVVAIPYTSIIEQTAQVFRDVFGDDAVLEHHSNLDPDRETPRSRLSAENWDAPIIVTTNVQLFESLFAARTSACRKLHNLVDSIVILDEAQMLPPEYLKPILRVLRGLVDRFGVSAVLCTATQPALIGRIGGLKNQNKASFEGLPSDGSVRELIRNPAELARSLVRVKLERHPKRNEPCSWDEIASELLGLDQVLCIVNSRKDCRDLHALLPPDTIHLSALMCGEHRSEKIAEIKRLLRDGNPVRVVSTQLVEAGVDLDFPVVYRAMAGLDSIAQAAGRCNREGRSEVPGRVVLFTPPKPARSGLLLKGETTTAEMLHLDPALAESLAPEAFRRYFELFYAKASSFDAQDMKRLLETADPRTVGIQFRTAASRFKLIDDAAQKAIAVWFDGERFKGWDLIEDIQRFGPDRKRMRRLQRYTVTIPQHAWKRLVEQGALVEMTGNDGKGIGLWAQALPGLYDKIFGLRLEGPAFKGNEFIC